METAMHQAEEQQVGPPEEEDYDETAPKHSLLEVGVSQPGAVGYCTRCVVALKKVKAPEKLIKEWRDVVNELKDTKQKFKAAETKCPTTSTDAKAHFKQAENLLTKTHKQH